MTSFAEALNIRPGITAVIGSGGKTSLLYRLAEELRTHRVLLATSTHIRRPPHLPFLEEVRQVQPGQPVCVGSYGPGGKLTAPARPLPGWRPWRTMFWWRRTAPNACP